ncbi:MAG TPA: dCTP deaminase [Candidatus Limnocylindrales bacterium]|nr:dCTP deaminase [Candidatus Limnocylindrales bacterium]
MILTDREIQVAIDTRQIIIKPLPDSSCYSSTSLDLKLAVNIREWIRPEITAPTKQQIVQPGAKGYSFNDFADEYSRSRRMSDRGYILEPGGFMLGWTKEKVELPINSRIAARVEGKSSLARIGIGIHITAPTIHAGFKGSIQLEICNYGCFRIQLVPDMPVCQLIFEQTLGTPVKGYKGQFYGQAGR